MKWRVLGKSVDLGVANVNSLADSGVGVGVGADVVVVDGSVVVVVGVEAGVEILDQ